MTRDNNLWLLAIAAAMLTYLGAHFDLLRVAFDAGPRTQALIELLAGLAGVGAGLMYKSPLPVSESGRVEAMRKNAEHAESAAVAATVAVDKALDAQLATAVAAEAAAEARDQSTKSADVP